MSNKNETNKNETNSRNEPEARRATAALLARSVQARFAAVARQAVALGLARAGAEEFTRITTGDLAHGFPEGSDYGALCPEDDLTKAQAAAIHEAAVQTVQSEAKRLMADASPEAVVLVAVQLAEWLEGSTAEWANACSIREQLDREDEEEREDDERKRAEAAREGRVH